MPVAVELHLVRPVRAVGDGGRAGGDAELENGAKIGILPDFRTPAFCVTVT
jgi:hypothetical protein